MSSFECPVVKINSVDNIANADLIESVNILGYRSVVKKNSFPVNSYAVYIPEGSIVPDWILQKLELVGKLAGPHRNRVKAVRIKQILSQGILYPVNQNAEGHMTVDFPANLISGNEGLEGADDARIRVALGDDVAAMLGITKWEPEIPAHMAGQVANIHGKTKGYDIENLKKYPNVMREGESIVATEKTHGTFTGMGYWPGLGHPELHRGDFFAYSKGNGAKGLVFKNVPENDNNIYHKVLKTFVTHSGHYYDEIMLGISMKYKGGPVYIFGEAYGPGIQDLNYNMAKPSFAVFDIWIGTPDEGRYLDDRELQYEIQFWSMPAVLEVFRGSFERLLLDKLKEGKTILGKGIHVREGIVIRPLRERRDDTIGRVILKHVGDGYLTRGEDGTEYQ